MMISNESKRIFAEALEFYESIKIKGKVEPSERHLFNLYKDEEVREVLEDVIEVQTKVKFVQLDPSQTIYIIPSFDNEYHQYNNKELRELWSLKDNAELYASQFSMLILLSMFYNSSTKSLSNRTSVSLGEFSKAINHYMSKLNEFGEKAVEQYSEELELDLKSILDVWNNRALVVETAKSPDKAPSGKIGLINRILKSLEKEDLLLQIGDEIKLTPKMDALIIRYYFNDSRREQLFKFLNSSIFSMKRDNNYGND
ncbi:DUF6063 family protein [Sutcliffiella horikoshii]